MSIGELEPPTLASRPLYTLSLFLQYMGNIIFASLKQAMLSPLTTYLVYPAIACYVVLKAMGLFPEFVLETELWFSYSSWWLILGILSSIGLGSGLHSGMLFLFPHIFRVCLAVESCGHTSFDVRDDVWLRGNNLHCEPRSQPLELSTLGSTSASLTSRAPVTTLDLFCKVIYTGMIWGAGTAIGEVPPYLFSYMMQTQQQQQEQKPAPSSEEVTTTTTDHSDTATTNGHSSSEHSTGSLPEAPLPHSELRSRGTNGQTSGVSAAPNGSGHRRSEQKPASTTALKAGSKAEAPEALLMKTLQVGMGAQPGLEPEAGSLFTSIEGWLSNAVNKHGFLMVASLASFPNPLFDMCGLACGRCRMPFATFFSATVLGKGIVKVCIQTGFLVAVFQQQSREAILERLRVLLPNPVPLLSPDAPLGQSLSESVYSGITQFQEIKQSKQELVLQEGVRKIATDQQGDLWGDLSMHSMVDGSAWVHYAQSFVPSTSKQLWSTAVGLLMTMFMWSFINTLAQVQWKASQQQLQSKRAKIL